MSKENNLLKKISENSKFILKLQQSQNLEEFYKICTEINPALTQEEIEKLPLDDKELEEVAGGKMDFNKFKSSAIAALLLVGGIGPIMEAEVSAAQSTSSTSTVTVNQKQDESDEKLVSENEIENLYNEAVKLYKEGNKELGLKKLREVLHIIKKNVIENLYNEAIKLYNEGNKEAGLKKLGEAIREEQDLHGYLDWEKELDGEIPTSYDHITGEMSTSAFDDVDYNVWRGEDGKFYHEKVGRDANPRFIATKEATTRMLNNFKADTNYKP